MRRRRELSGQVVLITGGSRGLGLELAREAVQRKARVAICARDAGALESARRELDELGGDVVAVQCDVGDGVAVEAMVGEVTRRLGDIDVLIANAGIITVGPVETQRLDDLRDAMDVMYWGAVHPVLAVIPAMRARRRGSIAVITSIGGKVAVPHLLPYATAKFAAVGLAEGLAAELAPQGIDVTTIVPGLMRTGSHVNALFKGRHRAEYSWFSLGASLPLLTVDVRRAATICLDAIEHGRREVFIGAPARILATAHALFPATTIRLLSAVDRLLPGASPSDVAAHRGKNSETPVSESPLTALGRRAAHRQRQHQPVGTAR